jgi:CubicO group peptidase (beta-lactamase class C family)
MTERSGLFVAKGDAAPADTAPEALMRGHPVPAVLQVRWDDASMWRWPQTRWSFSNFEQLVPLLPIRRAGPEHVFARAERDDLDGLSLTSLDGRAMTVGQALAELDTDGIMVLHKGQVVLERYHGAFGPAKRHIAFSVTKSFVGTLAECLIAEGQLDPAAPLAALVPEFAGSGFATATVRQVADMRTDFAYSEEYEPRPGELSDVSRMSIAAGGAPRLPGYEGPDGIMAYTASLGPAGPHGGNFVYRTPNTQALAWVLERLTGQSICEQIEARWWRPMGMAMDAGMMADRIGSGFAGGGLVAGLADLARFGEMMRCDGMWQGQRLVPAAAMASIRSGGDPAAFAHTQYPGFVPGGSYACQWWHRANGAFLAAGIHGQGIYIDPAADVVIARFGSHPRASNRFLNPVAMPAYDALIAAIAG